MRRLSRDSRDRLAARTRRAAIASAIDDAIGIPGAIDRIPVTPQRLMEILNGTK